MEIVNRKEIKKFLNLVIVITLVFMLVPVLIYILNFKGENISDSSADWGTFGDYIGGIAGTFLNLIAALFSLVSVYITLRIATRIHESEQRFNEDNIEREKERFEKEIELTIKQNKPYLYVDLKRLPDETKINLSNYGIGPLIIKEIKIFHGEKNYSYLYEVIESNLDQDQIKNCLIFHNTNPHYIIAPNSSKKILHIYPENKLDNNFINSQKKCRSFLKDCEITIKYEDIFENEDTYKFNLSFLKA